MAIAAAIAGSASSAGRRRRNISVAKSAKTASRSAAVTSAWAYRWAACARVPLASGRPSPELTGTSNVIAASKVRPHGRRTCRSRGSPTWTATSVGPGDGNDVRRRELARVLGQLRSQRLLDARLDLGSVRLQPERVAPCLPEFPVDDRAQHPLVRVVVHEPVEQERGLRVGEGRERRAGALHRQPGARPGKQPVGDRGAERVAGGVPGRVAEQRPEHLRREQRVGERRRGTLDIALRVHVGDDRATACLDVARDAPGERRGHAIVVPGREDVEIEIGGTRRGTESRTRQRPRAGSSRSRAVACPRRARPSSWRARWSTSRARSARARAARSTARGEQQHRDLVGARLDPHARRRGPYPYAPASPPRGPPGARRAASRRLATPRGSRSRLTRLAAPPRGSPHGCAPGRGGSRRARRRESRTRGPPPRRARRRCADRRRSRPSARASRARPRSRRRRSARGA